MKLIDALAADYWIANTKRIYEENLHVSDPVMDAYRAGFEKALELSAEKAHAKLSSVVSGIMAIKFLKEDE
jgi:hypothetical protein